MNKIIINDLEVSYRVGVPDAERAQPQRLLITVAVSVLGVMLFFVLPRFEGLFHSLGSALPPTTQFLIDLSNLMRNYWWIGLPCLIIAGFGAKLWAASSAGKDMIATFLVRAPHVGKLFRSFLFVDIGARGKPAHNPPILLNWNEP